MRRPRRLPQARKRLELPNRRPVGITPQPIMAIPRGSCQVLLASGNWGGGSPRGERPARLGWWGASQAGPLAERVARSRGGGLGDRPCLRDPAPKELRERARPEQLDVEVRRLHDSDQTGGPRTALNLLQLRPGADKIGTEREQVLRSGSAADEMISLGAPPPRRERHGRVSPCELGSSHEVNDHGAPGREHERRWRRLDAQPSTGVGYSRQRNEMSVA